MIRRKLLATVSVAMLAIPGLAYGASEPLNTALSSGYDALANSEYWEVDIRDGDIFRMKKRKADAGGWVEPEKLADWQIPSEHMDGLTDARARLMDAYDRGGDLVTPEHVAGAQVAFDCWVQEAEENNQPEEIERCKAKFEEHYAQIQYPTYKEPVDPDAAKVHDPISFNVYFDFDSTKLDDEAMANIRSAAEAVREEVPATIAVGGHTDTSGSNDYNEKLSKARAEVVAAALIAEGVPEDLIEIAFFGETQPRIQTADAVRERGNRRAEVRLRFEGYKSVDGLFGGVPGPDQAADEPMDDAMMMADPDAEAPAEDADMPAFMSEEQPMEEAPMDEPMTEEPALDDMEAPAEDAMEEPMMDEAPAEEPMMDEAPAEEPMAEEPMMDEAPAEEPAAAEPSGGGEDLPDFLQDDSGASAEEDPLGFL